MMKTIKKIPMNGGIALQGDLGVSSRYPTCKQHKYIPDIQLGACVDIQCYSQGLESLSHGRSGMDAGL